MKRVLLAAASAFACIPGLAAILSGLGAPPTAGVWFGGLATSMGVVTILIVMLHSPDLARVQTKIVTRWAVVLLGVGAIMILFYTLLFDWCVVSNPKYGAVVYPLWATGDLAKLIVQAGGRWEALDRYGIAGIDAAIQKSSSVIWTLTIGSFVTVYSTLVVCFTAAFALPAARLEGPSNRKVARKRSNRRPKAYAESGASNGSSKNRDVGDWGKVADE